VEVTLLYIDQTRHGPLLYCIVLYGTEIMSIDLRLATTARPSLSTADPFAVCAESRTPLACSQGLVTSHCYVCRQHWEHHWLGNFLRAIG